MPKKTAKKAASRRMVEVSTPNKPGYVGRLDAERYEAMRALLLKVLPKKGPGLTQAEMFAAVIKTGPDFRGAHAWWAKGVQLDLEAKGVLTRDSGKPLRWRRV